MAALATQAHDGVVLSVRVKPRASKSRVLGQREGALEVAVAAPPVDGEANQELVRTVATHFGLPRTRVKLVAGASSKNKVVLLVGVVLVDVEPKLKSTS